MRYTRCRLIVPVLVLAVAACSERPTTAVEPAVESMPEMQATFTSASCGLVSSIWSDIREFYPEPERYYALAGATLLGTSCYAGKPAIVTYHAVHLLSSIENLLGAGRAGDGAAGARLVGNLLACASGACSGPMSPALDLDLLARAMSHNSGMFALRTGTSTVPALARGKSSFANGNAAQWGVAPPAAWTEIAGAGIVLIYGAPPVSGGALGETGLQYELKRWPNDQPFTSAVQVGACFDEEYAPAHDHNEPSPAMRLRRNNALVQYQRPDFCPPDPAHTASIFAPVLSMARSLLPSGWFAAGDVGVRIVGGSALDFSLFTPLETQASNVQLQWSPNPGLTTPVADVPFGPITVSARAMTSLGVATPIHNVAVTLSVLKNRGEPAGAFVQGTTTATTDEAGLATFTAPFISKPGGYIICASGELEGYTFQNVCTERFNVHPK